MKNSIKKFTYLLVVVAALALVGCASDAKKENKGDSNSTPSLGQGNDKVDNSGMVLELNGDSDSNKAGGLKTIYFPYDSDVLTQDSEMTLKNNISFLMKNDKIKVQVEGHCDERGSVQYNIALGEKRAKSIMNYLVASGVASSRVSTVSLGKEKPLELGHNEESWSKNRRGNFIVVEK